MSDEPDIFSILLGRMAYGCTPEVTTAWCRVMLVVGLMAGFFIGVTVCGR